MAGSMGKEVSSALTSYDAMTSSGYSLTDLMWSMNCCVFFCDKETGLPMVG